MSDKIGPLALGKENEEVFLGMDISKSPKHSDRTAELIDDEIKKIISTAKQRATKILEENKDKLENLVKALIERETLNGEQIDKIMKGEQLEPVETVAKNKENDTEQKETPKQEDVKEKIENEENKNTQVNDGVTV